VCGLGGGVGGCPACGGPIITDLQRGEVVCTQCGLVISEAVVDVGPEWRVYNERDMKRVRAAPMGPIVKTDMAVKLEHGV
jgi:transcription initiation factor TFIIB